MFPALFKISEQKSILTYSTSFIHSNKFRPSEASATEL